MADLVSFDHATLGYGRRVILSDLTFSLPEGDFLGMVGPNGAGKTTILRAILRTLEPLAGTVTHTSGIRFGYVPQRDQVDYNFPQATVIPHVRRDRYRGQPFVAPLAGGGELTAELYTTKRHDFLSTP